MKKTILVFSGLILAVLLLFQISAYSINFGNSKIELVVAIIAIIFFFIGVYINKKSLHKKQMQSMIKKF
jgi:predicted tellurium resistance membrane protein TerC